jgi:hypothetical protein
LDFVWKRRQFTSDLFGARGAADWASDKAMSEACNEGDA